MEHNDGHIHTQYTLGYKTGDLFYVLYELLLTQSHIQRDLFSLDLSYFLDAQWFEICLTG